MILDINTKKSRKLCQELADATFNYMRHNNNPDLTTTPFKQTTSKKRLIRALEAMMEFLDPSNAKLKKLKPSKIIQYTKPGQSITLINKP